MQSDLWKEDLLEYQLDRAGEFFGKDLNKTLLDSLWEEIRNVRQTGDVKRLKAWLDEHHKD